MKSNEVLRAQITNTKQAAYDINKSESTVAKYQQNGEPNPLEIVLGIIKSQPGSAIAQLVAVESGGFYISGFDPTHAPTHIIFPKVMQDTTNLLSELAKSMEDGTITKDEAISIKSVLGELVSKLYGYLDCVEAV